MALFSQKVVLIINNSSLKSIQMYMKRNNGSQQQENEHRKGHRVFPFRRLGDAGQHVLLPLSSRVVPADNDYEILSPLTNTHTHTHTTAHIFLLPYRNTCAIIALCLHYLCLDIREFQFLG